MEILAHGLWAGAVAKGVHIGKPKMVKSFWTGLWGIFPDVFAFSVAWVYFFFSKIFSFMTALAYPHPDHIANPSKTEILLSQITHQLYAFSHSFIIFGIIFLAVYWFKQRPFWELSGWFVHIVMDIPTHTLDFYPTPIFWPVSNVVFGGIKWATWQFELINYAFISFVYSFLWFLTERRQKN